MRARSIGLAVAVALLSDSAAADQPVVLELFTSESCSSCPPADALLGELAQDHPEILPLAFHVTYWDGAGWRDPFALPEATARQKRYASLLPDGEVYTPEAVIGGRESAIGSDRHAVLGAIRRAAGRSPAASLDAVGDGGAIRVTLSSGAGAGTIWVVGYDALHRTEVKGGENGGRSLVDANSVRGISAAGRWTGAAFTGRFARPPGEHAAVLVQADDGGILAATRVAE
ncbi:MAG TPA: DUF1223 domain-containing protein [Stellaceae bacterium]|nr:DUF1223 domain-containing protein [Stellaceae bacterium]